jgi:hypothetical protein
MEQGELAAEVAARVIDHYEIDVSREASWHQ